MVIVLIWSITFTVGTKKKPGAGLITLRSCHAMRTSCKQSLYLTGYDNRYDEERLERNENNLNYTTFPDKWDKT